MIGNQESLFPARKQLGQDALKPAPDPDPVVIDKLATTLKINEAMNGLIDPGNCPMVFEDGRPFTDARNLNDEQVRQLIQQLEQRLDWSGAGKDATAFWKTLRRDFELHVVLRLCEELAHRGATIKQFAMASKDCAPTSIQAALHFLDYRLAHARYLLRTPAE